MSSEVRHSSNTWENIKKASHDIGVTKENITSTCVTIASGALLASLAVKIASLASTLFVPGGLFACSALGFFGYYVAKSKDFDRGKVDASAIFKLVGVMIGSHFIISLSTPTGGNVLASMGLGLSIGVAAGYLSDLTTRKIIQLIK